MATTAAERARRVRLMLFDVDGVLTDGRLYLSDGGHEIKAFHARDGQGIKLLQAAGIAVGIITARESRAVERRARELDVQLLRQGAREKSSAFAELARIAGVDPGQAGYMGDDLADLSVLQRCIFAATVPEAAAQVRDQAHYVAQAAGGAGAVREVCEFILQSQDSLDRVISPYRV